MEDARDLFYREQLMQRRRNLEAAASEFKQTVRLMRLMQEVDTALRRLDECSFGVCELCHDPIEEERLVADPLVTVCLDHMTPEQHRQLEDDLDLAHHIQGQFIPKGPITADGWEARFHYEPAGVVSGDYLDLLSPAGPDGDLYFLLGDVAGKGVAASMLMAHLHALFRSLIWMHEPVGEMMERANRIFAESTLASQYATLALVKASGDGGLEICNAGHCPPLLLQGDEVHAVEATGLPLGMFSEGSYETRSARIEPGDGVLLYTDGITEAMDGSGAEYGAERLAQLAAEGRNIPLEELVLTCVQDVQTFTQGKPRTDDRTLMAIRRVE
ncbi:MAG: hypothetical protein C4524_00170 [Candidatus Zixiibacteriota bacterium]|nr:MAG: hypothetical protein C4524_00170 [candidate division Zixibacteria bacterium]